jgi:phosphoglycolate phosphatase-like HAD superfamily hydrolase
VTTARTLVLWDIDNTLLYTGGAGSLGMRRAFAELYGVDDAFKRVEFSGRTDTAIFSDAAREHGIEAHRVADEQARFLEAYVPHLQAALHEVKGRLMPGVGEVLAALSQRAGVVQALGTGNFRRGGELKLRYYGIDRYFPGMPGGFGEESELRHVVIANAIARLSNGARPRVVVVGDTPHDITAAHANGAFGFGVATGRDSVDDLRAAGADIALDDLGEVDRVLEILLG